MRRQLTPASRAAMAQFSGFFDEVVDFLAPRHEIFRELAARRVAAHRLDSTVDATFSARLSGMRQGVGDLLQMTRHLSMTEIDDLNRRLQAKGLPTLTRMRLQFWGRRIPAILRRRRIRNEDEYYLLCEAVDEGGEPVLSADDLQLARTLVTNYSLGASDA